MLNDSPSHLRSSTSTFHCSYFLATYYCTRVENSCQLNCALQVVQCDAILHVIGDAVCRVIGDAVCRLISILAANVFYLQLNMSLYYDSVNVTSV